MPNIMYVDAFAGAAGDMILGAFIDAGLPIGELRAALGSLGVDHEIVADRVVRAGISATHVDVRGGAAGQRHAHTHSHSHDHHHHHHDDHGHAHHNHEHHHDHHSIAEINAHIERSSLTASATARAVAMFKRLAEAEAAIHDTAIERVHLHEVGALDSIIDIVGAAFAFEWWGIDDVVVSPMNVGAGTIRIAHGDYPVPAPATLRLLAGAPVTSAGPAAELLTPTGALVLTSYARGFGRMPAMTVERVGYGAGTKDFAGFPNVLRVVIGTRSEAATSPEAVGADVLRIECEIDDMNPQLFGPVVERLMGAGALDAFLTPIQMKKGRPGALITVLAPADRRSDLCTVLFRETTTLGVRFDAVQREVLDRRWDTIQVAGHPVRVKVATRGGEVINAAPEFDDCLAVAQASGRPLKEIQALAMHAWLSR